MWLPGVVAAIACVVTCLLHVPLQVLPLWRDQGLWLTAGMAMKNGKVFYTDLLHFHLPGTAFAYRFALLFTDNPRTAVTLLSAIASVVTIAAIFLLLRRTISAGAGALAALLFGILWPLRLSWLLIAQKDFLAVPWVLFAVWFAARSTSKDRWAGVSLVAAGVCTAIAVQYKPTFGLVGILIGIGLLVRWVAEHFLLSESPSFGDTTTWRGWKNLLAEWGLLALGGCLGLVPLVVYLVWGNALTDAYYCLSSLGATYVSANQKPAWKMLERWLEIQRGHSYNFSDLTLVLCGFGMALVVFGRRWKQRLWLLVPVIMAVASFLIQAKGFKYHMDPWYVALCMLFGIVLARSWNVKNVFPFRTGSIAWILIAIVSAGCLFQCMESVLTKSAYVRKVIPVWRGEMPRKVYLKKSYRHKRNFPNPAYSEKLARWIRKRTDADDTILVWGHESQIYVLARRMYATQAPFDQMLTGFSPKGTTKIWHDRQRARFVKLLEVDQPKFFIVTTKDGNPVERLPSDKSLKLVPGLKKYLAKEYAFVRNVGRFRVYQRQSTINKGNSITGS